MVFGFGEKKKAPEASKFLTAAGPTRESAEKFQKATVAFKKEAKHQKPPPQGAAVRLSTGNVIVATKRERDIFDPAKSFPGTVPYWTKEKKRVI